MCTRKPACTASCGLRFLPCANATNATRNPTQQTPRANGIRRLDDRIPGVAHFVFMIFLVNTENRRKASGTSLRLELQGTTELANSENWGTSPAPDLLLRA